MNQFEVVLNQLFEPVSLRNVLESVAERKAAYIRAKDGLDLEFSLVDLNGVNRALYYKRAMETRNNSSYLFSDLLEL